MSVSYSEKHDSPSAAADVGSEVYHFCVVCPDAEHVFLLGAFNNWSTSATPMRQTEEHVWQLSVKFPEGAGVGRDGGEASFAYFVIDKNFHTGRAAFGPTFLLPGSWATVVRTPSTSAA